MKFLPKNTLAYFNAAPQTHLHDLSKLPVSVLASSTSDYKAKCNQSSPTDDAVSFYTLNHAASIVRKSFTPNEPLPEWARTIMQTYTDVCMAQGERMLHYILCITTREMRHLKSCTDPFWKKVESTFDAVSPAILKHISSNGDENTAMNKYMLTPPDMPIGQYVKTLSYAFHNAGHAGWAGSYGGHPWGLTTDAVVAMIHGETSLEMMVDTGYTLAHNGGPIFDKHIGIYQGQNAQLLMTILDVQRSGQTLDLMLASETMGVHKTPEAEQAANLIKQHAPKEFKGYVDWKLVDALRPEKQKNDNPNKYAKVTSAQKQPVSAKPKAPEKAKPLAQVLTHVQGKKVKVTGTYHVFPNQSVTVYERTEK